MDSLELQIGKLVEAEYIDFYHSNVTTKVNGNFTGTEKHLYFDIYDSRLLNKLKHNEIAFKEKCNEIKELVLNNVDFSTIPQYSEFRIRVIETHGFSIFKSEESKMVSYR